MEWVYDQIILNGSENNNVYGGRMDGNCCDVKDNYFDVDICEKKVLGYGYLNKLYIQIVEVCDGQVGYGDRYGVLQLFVEDDFEEGYSVVYYF